MNIAEILIAVNIHSVCCGVLCFKKLSDLTEEYVVKFCPTLASVTGLLGGYKVASSTGIRPLGGGGEGRTELHDVLLCEIG